MPADSILSRKELLFEFLNIYRSPVFPDAVQIIKASCFLVKDMNDHTFIVKQRPVPVLMPFNMVR